ncbi:MAG TPA: hypothetical protein VMU69_32885 [Bradyrhizobium sp.]|nr:hypothetical protein [Bradyrhizobium sp.]
MVIIIVAVVVVVRLVHRRRVLPWVVVGRGRIVVVPVLLGGLLLRLELGLGLSLGGRIVGIGGRVVVEQVAKNVVR